ncbi:hypothetical protein VNO80_18608 [Phaseolus coccineus]|uniref:Uncharacterized protein n=1 Tax=Phaseolus coccineus TaxID=3886 RepID=A0AAN9MKR1_PHACN
MSVVRKSLHVQTLAKAEESGNNHILDANYEWVDDCIFQYLSKYRWSFMLQLFTTSKDILEDNVSNDIISLCKYKCYDIVCHGKEVFLNADIKSMFNISFGSRARSSFRCVYCVKHWVGSSFGLLSGNGGLCQSFLGSLLLEVSFGDLTLL